MSVDKTSAQLVCLRNWACRLEEESELVGQAQACVRVHVQRGSECCWMLMPPGLTANLIADGQDHAASPESRRSGEKRLPRLPDSRGLASCLRFHEGRSWLFRVGCLPPTPRRYPPEIAKRMNSLLFGSVFLREWPSVGYIVRVSIIGFWISGRLSAHRRIHGYLVADIGRFERVKIFALSCGCSW